jgi:hypothetical protein
MATFGSDPASPDTSTLTGVPVNAAAPPVVADVDGAASFEEEEHPDRARAAAIIKTEDLVSMSQSYN